MALAGGLSERVSALAVFEQLRDGPMMTVNSLGSLRGCAELHLTEYTAPDGSFAFRTYDNLWGRAGMALTPLDVLAARLLAMPIGWEQVIPMFASVENRSTTLLRQMQTVLDDPAAQSAQFVDLSSLDDPPFALFRAACLATERSGSEPKPKGWTAVGVSKVLHRLLPNLVPIIDSQVLGFYGLRAGSNPGRFYGRLQSDLQAHRDWMQALADQWETDDGRPLSLLRAADIIIWRHRTAGCTAGDDD